MIPIQIINNNNSCDGYNGALNSFKYGFTQEHKNSLNNKFSNVGNLAQYDTLSPYYAQATISKDYVKFLERISKCNEIAK